MVDFWGIQKKNGKKAKSKSKKLPGFNFGLTPQKKSNSKKIKVNPMFNFGIAPLKKMPRKDMNWTQAKARNPMLSPFGDVDRDGVKNWLDCKPFDRSRQDDVRRDIQIKDESIKRNLEIQNINMRRRQKSKAQLKEHLKSLEGQEFSSISHEGVIGIKEGKIIQGGKTIGKVTAKKAKKLTDEMFTEEFGYAPGSKTMQRELEKEFGPAVKKLEEREAHKERQARQDELNESIRADKAYEKLSPIKKAAVEEGYEEYLPDDPEDKREIEQSEVLELDPKTGKYSKYDIDEKDDITLDLPDEKEETFDVEDKDDKTLDLPGEEE